MFAILISSENLQEILSHQMTLPDHEPLCDPTVYLRNTQMNGRKWYYIRGYVGEVFKGTVASWGVLPAYRFEPQFDYDEEKIKTDWTIAVRQ